jgi:xylulokinase
MSILRTPTEPLLLGIDVGTSRLKLAVIVPTGRVIATASASYPTDRSASGHAEQDPDRWWAALRRALRELGGSIGSVDLKRIGAIGVAGQMHGVVAVNSTGRPVRRCMTWEDSRAWAELDDVRARIGAERTAQLSGSPLSAGFAAGMARWLTRHESGSIGRSKWLLQPKDWLRLRLTGEAATEPSDASGTLLFDITAGTWSTELLAAFDVEPRLLPPIVPSASVAGRLDPKVAAQLGLEPRLPVIAGGGDSPTTALGAGITASRRPQCGLLSFGTAAQIAVAIDRPRTDARCSYQLFRHVVDGEWLAVAAIPSAGSSMAWLARLLLPNIETGRAIDRLIAEAGQVPPGARGVLFVPHLLGQRSPRSDPTAAGAFVGLRMQHGRPEFARAVLEGVAHALRDGLDALRTHGFRPESLVLVGGAGDAAVWPGILSAILEIKIERVPDTIGAALGAAALAVEGAGIAPAISVAGSPKGETVEMSEDDVAAFRAIHDSNWADAVGACRPVSE